MKRILVVDDKVNVQTSLKIGLKREGYDVDVADDALKALMKVQENNYDILLSDVRMPYINGFVLASKVAQNFPNVRIVLMSAYGFDDYGDSYQGFDNYPKLSKPFEMNHLLDVLKNLNEQEVIIEV